MTTILIRNARVLTMLMPGEQAPPPQGRRGAESGVLGAIPRADVLLRDGRIASVGPAGAIAPSRQDGGDSRGEEIDADGRVLMPGFVDCHTHACWAGSRINEWERIIAGATYQEVAASGGGIMSTVRAVRAASEDELARTRQALVSRMLRLGTTTAEVKSGYGLTAEAELKLLRAITKPTGSGIPAIVPTALLGHAIDPEASSPQEFVRQTIQETLPQVSRAYPGITVDAFCEKGAWTVEDCTRLFEAARAKGHPIRLHVDQFTTMGMAERAIELGARSVDHLEASTLKTLDAIAASDTFAVGLPVCGFHLDGRYARLGEVIRRGGKVCIATNFNPGSAPTPSMAFVIALAARQCALTIGQAIVAATVNPALLLGFTDRGYIAPGARADLLLLRHKDERAIAYEVGDSPVDRVIVGGETVVS